MRLITRGKDIDKPPVGLLKNRYIAPSQTFKPKDIVDDVRERFGVHISYNKAWRAREAAYDILWGTPKESYSYLLAFLHVLV